MANALDAGFRRELDAEVARHIKGIQNYRANEWAGATFDASGQWLFVNIQTPGVTFAITGPWWRGPL
jgi:hypothetical protein